MSSDKIAEAVRPYEQLRCAGRDSELRSGPIDLLRADQVWTGIRSMSSSRQQLLGWLAAAYPCASPPLQALPVDVSPKMGGTGCDEGHRQEQLKKFWERPGCADARGPLHSWYEEALKAKWRRLSRDDLDERRATIKTRMSRRGR